MKTVVDSRTVAHLWANKSQYHARNAGNTFYFRDGTIYSYGEHFPIARHNNTGGKLCIFFTTRSYSVTTTKHISYTRRAIRHDATVFNVFDINATLADLIADYASRVKDAQDRFNQANKRNRLKAYRYLEAIASEAEAFHKFFKIRRKVKWERVEDDTLSAWETEINQRELARSAKLNAEKRICLDRWLIGERDVAPFIPDEPIRLRIKGEEIQTTLGARIPVEHGLKLLPFIRRGTAWSRNGQEIRLGNYFLDSIDEQGNIIAGCHKIERAEMERIATQLGV